MRLQSEVKEWFGRETGLPPTGRVHFVGIGGAGMSALARILLHKSREVSGSDVSESHTLDELREKGANVFLGHRAANVDGAEIVVVSDAIDLDVNPETKAARESGMRMIRRSQLLGELLKGYRVLAVTGSHGKSTTTAILAQILASAGFDPLAVVGADVAGFDGNVRLGNGDIAVVEACEAYDSFHDIHPEIVLLTNLEPEHLDYHNTWESLLASVARFVESASGDPKLVFCAEDDGAAKVAELVGGGSPYDSSSPIGEMQMIGEHNALNAKGAVAVAELIGVGRADALRGASKAVGCARRLERIGQIAGVEVFDDYAHHPTEIRASLAALRKQYPEKRIVVAFQPHLYSRTRDQLDAFGPSFSDADVVFLTDIYPARELPIPGISSALIAERLEKAGSECYFVPSRHLLPREVARFAEPDDIVVGMGAGNIDAFAPEFMKETARSTSKLRVAVFCGGDSAEREVSILSGTMAAEALREKGYEVSQIDATEIMLGKGDISSLIGPDRPDIVFIALHGTGAEDGAIQGLLELLHIPYTGTGILGSALAMDKEQTKRALAEKGIPTPRGVLVRKGDSIPDFSVPCVVKPNAQGSTIGLSFVRDSSELPRAVMTALKYCDAALIEEMVEGVEISVPVLEDQSIPAVEICPRTGEYDFASKYIPGETEEIVPARIGESAEARAREYALAAHRAVGALDMSRTDMIVNGDDVIVLEINTVPGMTSTSLLPKSALSAGIPYGDLCERILLSALRRYGIAKR